MWLAWTKASTVVPYRCAMAHSVSPGCTRYRAGPPRNPKNLSYKNEIGIRKVILYGQCLNRSAKPLCNHPQRIAALHRIFPALCLRLQWEFRCGSMLCFLRYQQDIVGKIVQIQSCSNSRNASVVRVLESCPAGPVATCHLRRFGSVLCPPKADSPPDSPARSHWPHRRQYRASA